MLANDLGSLLGPCVTALCRAALLFGELAKLLDLASRGTEELYLGAAVVVSRGVCSGNPVLDRWQMRADVSMPLTLPSMESRLAALCFYSL